MTATGWTIRDMPPQAGRVAVVTGATSGLGLEMVRALLGKGARVVIASRSPEKGAVVVAALRRDIPDADVAFEAVDLADLGSVRAVAYRLRSRLASLDLLVNNAGLSMPPGLQLTADGIERQFATNHLGHFLLTAELWPLLAGTAGARVVTVASVAHRRGRIAFDDVSLARRRYGIGRAAYAQSKLANLLFAIELQRRIDASRLGVKSIAAHPGLAATPLVRTGRDTGRDGSSPRVATRLLVAGYRRFSQSAADGALPLLYAATAPDAEGGGYYGPSGWLELRGPVGIAEVRPRARDPVAAARLWALSESLIGRPFDVRS
ncbi:MAG: oxidoreductase [Bauldia sp.]